MRVDCPIPAYTNKNDDGTAVYFVDIPDEWLGKHVAKRDEAIGAIATSGAAMNDTFRTFAVSLALADDWNLPGMSGKLSYDFSELSLAVMAWVNQAVWGSFNRCYDVPKNF